ncbi:MAG TPA: NTP transferase domain-containing protein [Streptosporangiaceae bacterium]|jgi:molybdopterin-guanine dinucleotide biosynthesis protein A
MAPAEPHTAGRAEAGRQAPYDAVILAGGAARRLGGADKPGLLVGGQPLIVTVAAAVAGARRLVIVGPPRPELPRAIVVREDPPGAGPVPALRAGLAEVAAPWTVLLAADLPFLRHADVAALLAEAYGHDGALLVDDAGHDQWLVGAWRTERLRATLAGYSGSSLRGMLAPLEPVRLRSRTGGRPPWYDCDTEQDVARAQALVQAPWMEE